MGALALVSARAGRATESKGVLAALGVVLTAVLVVAILLVVITFGGAFTRFVPVQAIVAGNGNAVAAGDQVIYRDVPIGKVVGSGHVLRSGDVRVSLHLIPYRVPAIPANVTATVDPVTIFGTEYVILNAPAHPAEAHLTAGTTVPAAPVVVGNNVQGTVNSLDNILTALHPAELDQALTAIATALRGQGPGLGRTLDAADAYLEQQLPYFPELAADLGLLAPVANQVASSAPQLVGALSNLTTTSNTITADASELHAALVSGAQASSQVDAVLAPSQRSLETIVDAAAPFFADLSQSPTELSRIVNGLHDWATSWSSAESAGPYLRFASSVPLANATDLVFAALNAPGTAGPGGLAAQALGTGSVDPGTYSSRSVPVASTTASTSPVAIDPAVLTAAEQQAAAEVATGLAGGRAPSSPTVAALYLAPVLNALVLQ